MILLKTVSHANYAILIMDATMKSESSNRSLNGYINKIKLATSKYKNRPTIIIIIIFFYYYNFIKHQ